MLHAWFSLQSSNMGVFEKIGDRVPAKKKQA